MRRSIAASGLLALASRAAAQVASYSASNDVTYKLNIPQNTASSGSGDIFFQLSAPSSYEWVALGQGSSMSGANIFVVYVSSSGNNVTISPRLGTGHQMPNFNSAAQVTLLEGSGVTNGKMVANVKCSSCNSWSGGSADFKSSSGNWIYAWKSSGGPKKSDDQSTTINQHSDEKAFNWNYASAKGGSSVNPLVSSSGGASGGASGTSSCVPRPTSGASGVAASATQSSDDDNTATTTFGGYGPWETNGGHSSGRGHYTKRQAINYCDDSSPSNNGGVTPISSSQSNGTKMLIAHGTLAALAFVVLFPMGAITVRLASFPGVIWIHAAFQAFAYLVYIAAFGLGVYIATEEGYLHEYHPIIGIVVFACLFFMPIFGFLHHSMFKKYGSRTFWSYIHLWLGRILITLGIINGGLGFMLAGNTRSGMIAYSVVAGVMWLLMVVASVYGELKRRRTSAAARAGPPKYTDSPRTEAAQTDIPPPPANGHYAPK